MLGLPNRTNTVTYILQPACKMMVQLLTPCTDPESHNAQHYRQTDGHDANSNNMIG